MSTLEDSAQDFLKRGIRVARSSGTEVPSRGMNLNFREELPEGFNPDTENAAIGLESPYFALVIRAPWTNKALERLCGHSLSWAVRGKWFVSLLKFQSNRSVASGTLRTQELNAEVIAEGGPLLLPGSRLLYPTEFATVQWTSPPDAEILAPSEALVKALKVSGLLAHDARPYDTA